jgi:hypothetical protein
MPHLPHLHRHGQSHHLGDLTQQSATVPVVHVPRRTGSIDTAEARILSVTRDDNCLSGAMDGGREQLPPGGVRVDVCETCSGPDWIRQLLVHTPLPRTIDKEPESSH